jgi:hypothetical protein
MPLNKKYVRDGKNRIIGSVTTGLGKDGEMSVVRDAQGRIKGRTSELFQNTRDRNGKIVSIDTADSGLLFGEDED